MELSDFKIRTVVFEIRYDTAYILWDRAGSIAESICKLWPGAELGDGKPNEQTLASEHATIITGLNSSRIVVRTPRTIMQFSEAIAESAELWIKTLNIQKLTRVGTRVIYARSFKSLEAAGKAIVELGLVKFPASPVFNHKDLPEQVDVRFLWKDEGSQTQVLIKPESQVIEVTTALPDEPKTKQKTVSNVVLLDIDRATKGTVEISRFRTIDWLQGVTHLILRDVDRILRAQ